MAQDNKYDKYFSPNKENEKEEEGNSRYDKYLSVSTVDNSDTEGSKKKDEENLSFGATSFVSPEEIQANYQTAAESTRVATKYEPSLGREISMSKIPAEAIKAVNENPRTEEEEVAYSIFDDVRDYYSDRGGITPPDKLATARLFKDEIDQLLFDKEINEQQYLESVNDFADKIGLTYNDETQSFSIFENEQKLFQEVYGRRMRAKLSKLSEKEQDTYLKDMWDALNNGSTAVLNTVSNVMAISEKIANAPLSEDKKSTYWQDIANTKAMLLEQQREANKRYDDSILDLWARGESGKALGQAVLAFVENVPQLMILALPSAAAAATAGGSTTVAGAARTATMPKGMKVLEGMKSRGGAVYMGVNKGSDEYLRLDRESPNLPEYMKTMNAFGKAVNEIVWESLGTLSILDDMRQATKIAGTQAIKNEITRATAPVAQRYMMAALKSRAPGVKSGGEEFMTELSDIILDMSMGLDPGDPEDRLVEASVVGWLSGEAMQSAHSINNYFSSANLYREQVRRVVSSIPNDYSFDAKADLIPLAIEDRKLELMGESATPAQKQIVELQRAKIGAQMESIAEKDLGLKEGELKGLGAPPKKIVTAKTWETDTRPAEETKEPAEKTEKASYSIKGESFKNKESFLKAIEKQGENLQLHEVEVTGDEETYREANDLMSGGTRIITDGNLEKAEGLDYVPGEVIKRGGTYLFGDQVNELFNRERRDEVTNQEQLEALRTEAKETIEKIGQAREKQESLTLDQEYAGKDLTEVEEKLDRRLFRLNKLEDHFKKLGYDSETEGQVSRSELEGEEPGRPVQEPGEGEGEIETDRVVQEEQEVEPPKRIVITSHGNEKGEVYEPIINKDGTVDFVGKEGVPDEVVDKKIKRNTTLYKRLRANYDAKLEAKGKDITERIVSRETEDYLNLADKDEQPAEEQPLEPEDEEAEPFYRKVTEVIRKGIKKPKGSKAELNQEELVSLMQDERQRRLKKAKSEKQRNGINSRFDTMVSNLSNIFSKNTDRSKIGRAKLHRQVLSELIQNNSSPLKRIIGRATPAVMRRINDIRADKGFVKAVDYIDGVINNQQKKELAILESRALDFVNKATDINSNKWMLKGLKVLKSKLGKGGLPLMDRLKDIAAIKDMTFEEITDAKFEGGKYKAVWDKINESGIESLTDAEYQLYENSLYTNMEAQSQDNIIDLAETLTEIINKEKTSAHDFNDMIKRMNNQERKMWIAYILGDTELIDKVGEKVPDEKSKLKKYINASTEWLTLRSSSWHSVLDIMSMKSQPDSKIFGSDLNLRFARPIHKANSEYSRGSRETAEVILEKNKEIFGEDYRSILEDNKKKQDIPFTDERGNEVVLELSQNEAAYLWAHMQNEDLHPTFAGEKMGYMKENEDGTYSLTNRGEALDNFVTPEMKELVDWHFDYYGKLYDRYNDIYREMFGRDMPYNEIYMPIVREGLSGQDGIDEMMKSHSFASFGANRHLYKRVGGTQKIGALDIQDVMTSYVQKMEWFSAYAPVVKDLRTFFSSPKMMEAVRQEYGDTLNKVIQNFIDEYAGNPQRNWWNWAIPKIDAIRRNFTLATLALKFPVLIKQLSSFPAYATFIPPAQLVKGMYDFLGNPAKWKEKYKTLLESEYIRDRYASGALDRDIADLMAGKFGKIDSRKRKYADIMMSLVKAGDKAPIIVGGWAVYKHHYDQNMKDLKGHSKAKQIAHERALQRFELATKATQQSAKMDDLSVWQRGGSFQKLLTMYMTAPWSYQRLVSAGMRRAFSGGGTESLKEGTKAALIGHVVLPVLFQMASQGFKFDEPDDYWNLVQAGVVGNLNTIFIFGDILGGVLNNIRGRNFGYQLSPVATVGEDISKAFGVATEHAKSLGMGEELGLEDIFAFLDAAALPISYLGVPGLGALPYPGLKSMGKGAAGVIKGDSEYPIREIIGYSKGRLNNYKWEDEPDSKYEKYLKELKEEDGQGQYEKYLKKLKGQ